MAKRGALPAIELSGGLSPTYSQGPDHGVCETGKEMGYRVVGGPAIRAGGVIDPSYRLQSGGRTGVAAVQLVNWKEWP